MNETQHEQYFKAESEGWARLAFVTASSRHRFLAIYRDDQIAPIGTGFAQEFYSSAREFKNKRSEWMKKGFYHQYFQGFGSATKRRYVALYVANNKPIERTERITGKPQVGAIDKAVLDWMKGSNIRGAALAIVKDTKLVLARGYTWAEPDYPDVTPKTMFRLGSTSKMITSLSIHQLAAEGKLNLTDLIDPILQLQTADGEEPDSTIANHQPYLTTTVGGLLESTCKINPHYESQNEAIVKAAGKEGQVPATSDQIASWLITQPPATDEGPNDGGFFLAAEVVKRVRELETFEEAFEPRILKPLNIAHIKIAHSLHKDMKAGDARHHSRELKVTKSIMSPDRPIVFWGYGEDNYQTFAPSGGFAAAALDYARILAALNCRPYNPLGRTTVDSLIGSAKASGRGHGFDKFKLVDAANNVFEAYKGGLLNIGQSGIHFEPNGFGYVMLWNGVHYGSNLRDFDPIFNKTWWPRFNAVLDPAKAQAWSSTDLFPDPDFTMPSFPNTEDNWRHCKKCQSLYLHGNPQGDCPGEGKHAPGTGTIPNYRLMVNSDMDYGEKNWRRCIKCRCLFFTGKGTGKCAAGGNHDTGTSPTYSLVNNSPYKEHDQDWRRCAKCQTLFFGSAGSGKCAVDGGAHDSSQGDVYSIAKT